MQIRPATADDAHAVETVRIEGWRTAYRGLIPDSYLDALEVTPDRVEVWRGRISSGGTSTWVGDVDGSVVGMATAGPSREEDGVGGCEIYALYVSPSTWREGLGTALLAACEPVDLLWVLEDNTAARAFYERHGFRADGAAKQFDADGTGVREIRMLRTAAGS